MCIPLRSIYYGGDFRSSTAALFIEKLVFVPALHAGKKDFMNCMHA